MKKTLLIALVGILLVSLASAQYDAGVFQKDLPADLQLPCSWNGTFCAPTLAECNVTVTYPNGSLLLDNINMTNIGNGMPNATLPDSSVADKYTGFYICCQADICDSSPISFEITATGSVLSTGQGIVYIVFLIAIIFIFSLCLYGAIEIPWKHTQNPEGRVIGMNELRWLKVMLYFFSYMLLMFMFGVTRSILYNFLFLPGASAVFNWLYWIMFSFMFPVIVVSLVVVIVNFVASKKMSDALTRGVPLR